MKIYTKKGDFGETSLRAGVRVNKSDQIIEVIGSLDELNAQIGYLISLMSYKEESLTNLQKTLFKCGAGLAIDKDSLGEAETQELEKLIDMMTLELPPLTNFILPGGSQEVAWAHVVRTTVRRVERQINRLDRKYPFLSKFINRLSDYFFTLSRHIAYKTSRDEVIWKSEKQVVTN